MGGLVDNDQLGQMKQIRVDARDGRIYCHWKSNLSDYEKTRAVVTAGSRAWVPAEITGNYRPVNY